MPGFVGIVSHRPQSECTARLRRMLDALRQECEPAPRVYSAPGIGLHVGWVPREPPCGEYQPLSDERGETLIYLFGEVQNGSMSELHNSRRGHRTDTYTAEHFVRMYRESGVDFFLQLNGLFAGVLIDKRKGIGFIYNDRYGMRRLFVHEDLDGVHFASEAKALLAVLPDTRTFDPEGLAQLVTCGCTMGSRSPYRGISVLPGASIWRIANGTVARKSTYFDRAEWESLDKLSPSRFTESVVSAIVMAVRRLAKAECPMGVSLTGGLDTRVIMACLELPERGIPCYTFGSMYRDTYDVRIAQRLARRCGQDHTVLVLGDKFLRDFPSYLEGAVYRSDGYLGLSGAAELYLNSLAKRIAPIKLTGNYGSELLRHARAFKCLTPKIDYLVPDLAPHLKKARQTFFKTMPSHPVSFSLFFHAPFQGYGRMTIEESQLVTRTPFMDNDLVKLVYQRPPGSPGGAEMLQSVIRRCRPRLLEVETDRGDLGIGGELGRAVRKAYREAHFKAEYYANHGMPHWLSALSTTLPWLLPVDLLLGHHKFQHFRPWARKELSSYISDVLDPTGNLPGYLDRSAVRTMVRRHLNGRSNFIEEVDGALMIVLIERTLLAASSHADRRT